MMLDTVRFLIEIFGQGFPCLFQVTTGLYCPGCGGTRATFFLLHGELMKSLQYHPLVPYMALVAVLELGSYALSRIFKKPGIFVERYAMFTYIGIGIVVVNWMFKNYMLVARGIDLLP